MYIATPHALEGGVSREHTLERDVDSVWMLTMALLGSRLKGPSARVQKGDCVYSIVIA